MDRSAAIERTRQHVAEKLRDECTGHDWWHTYRVWQLARHIGQQEQADVFICEMAALLHDLADWKFFSPEPGQELPVEAWLQSLELPTAICAHIVEIIAEGSFKGAKVADVARSIEAKVVQDADRLDALGAIGIARTFAYGGYKQRLLYDPEVLPVFHDKFSAYKQHQGNTINHFYEKLLLLKDRMHTNTAKAIANKRHEFMQAFLDEFHAEWQLSEIK